MTTLLAAVHAGEPDAAGRLHAALYPEIKRLALAVQELSVRRKDWEED